MLASICSGAQVGLKTLRGRGNSSGREYQGKPRGQNKSEWRRNLHVNFQSSPQHFHYASKSGASRGLGEWSIKRNEFPLIDQFGRNVDQPALNKGRIFTDDIDLENRHRRRRSGEMVGRFADNNVETLEERGHESPRTMNGKWVQSQGGMKQAQSMPAVNQTFDEHRHDETLNEQDTALFERKKMLVSGLDEKTTDNTVLNFIEAMSREEVEDVVMLGKGRALVTMLQDITSK